VRDRERRADVEKLQPEDKVRKITEAFIKSRGMSVVLPDISDLGSGIADIAAKDDECLVLVRIEARFGYDPAPPPPFSLNRRRVFEVVSLLESNENLPAFSKVRLDLAMPRIVPGNRALMMYVHDHLEMQDEPLPSRQAPKLHRGKGKKPCEPER
jgi:hypothetical protein